MKVLIIGAGNTGHAAAAFLSKSGHDVFLFTRSKEKAARINKNGIHCSGAINGHFNPMAVWQLDGIIDPDTAVFVFTTADAHVPVFKLLKPLVCSNQRIIIFNSNWGAYEGCQVLNDVLKKKNVIIAETGSMPFIASADAPGRVNIKSIKDKTTISALNPDDTGTLIDEFEPVLPGLLPAPNIVSTSISATNPVIHVPICVFNFARVENGDEFKFYGNGVSKKTVEYISCIDLERVVIAKKLNIECGTVLEAINSYWPVKHDNLYDALKKNDSYKNVIGPKTTDHRYLDEDIPFGLVPIVKLGKELNINTPCTSTIIDIASFYTQKDYMAEGVDVKLNHLTTLLGI